MTTSLTTAEHTGYDHPGHLLEALAHQDFVTLADALEGDVQLRALVAKGLVEPEGSAEVADRFWFRDGRRVDEQQAYVTCAQSGRISRIDLLCTGYIPVGKELLP